MDPFSLTVGVLGIVTAAQACLKTIKKRVGRSAMSSAEIEDMMKTLYEIHGAMGSFKTHLDLHDDDEDRLESLQYLMPVMTRSSEALQIVKNFVNSGRTEKAFRGVKFDKEVKLSLKRLDDASEIFSMAVVSNQQLIMMRVNKYVHAISNDVADLQAVQRSAHQDDLYLDIRAWLASQGDNNINSQFHERNLLARQDGSGSWLMNQGEFQSWLTTKENGPQTKIWLRGSPGVGKSILCSTAIEHVSKHLQQICLYYFYRFDDQPEAGSSPGVGAAALLVDQLLRHFWQRDQGIATLVSDLIKTREKTMTSLAEVARMILKHGYQCSQEHGTTPQGEPLSVYLFLDGLDEIRDSHAAVDILMFFENLDQEPSVVHKTWISSRETNVLKTHLGQWPVVNVDKHGEVDVKDFLTLAVPKLENNEEASQQVEGIPLDEWVLQKLQEKARSNFLYAKLMTEWLQEDVFTIDEVIDFIKSRVPNNIAEMYKRIFRQYQEDQHKYISILFSLVAFARRPLRLYELREAMTIALSDRTKGLDPRRVPRNLPKLFAPLVETQSDPNEPENPLCRLCHSTVHEFLVTNPDVLDVKSSNQVSLTYQISASQVGDVCLRYLSQSRYSAFVDLAPGARYIPLRLMYDDAQQHGLLPYSAKYWDRHLEDLEPNSESWEELLKFVQSPNFQTLIQVQSLFITGHFTQFRLEGSGLTSSLMYRRSMPSWFGLKRSKDKELDKASTKIRRDYRHFVHEWGYLLEHGICADSSAKCLRQYFCGEVDRCLTGLLGPDHFMKQMKEKYPSFMLTQEAFEMHKSEKFIIADSVCASASQFAVLSSSSDSKPGEMSLERWDLGALKAPRCVSRDTVFASKIDFRADTGQCIAFSNSIAKLLLGTKGSDLTTIFDQRTHANFEPLTTDVDMRDGIIVVANRNVRKQLRNKQVKKNAGGRKATKVSQGFYSDSSETGSDDDSDDGYSTCSTNENSAYETCSEGSTEHESGESSDEMTKDDLDSDGQSEESSDESSDEETEEDERDIDPEKNKAEMKAEEQQTRKERLVVNRQQLQESSLELEGDLLKQKQQDRPTYPGMPSRVRDPKDRITATVSVYNVTSGQAIRMFHYEHDTAVTSMLYHSPPVLHPNKTLFVWPLGGGEVLFADFEEKTYFIRATMPTTKDTRHICMKIHFSSCGEYIHIASVEGRLLGKRTSSSATPASGGTESKPEILLSVFVTTHRLSKRKTTRSPPQLVHKVKLTLGQFTGLSLAKLPFTFIWASDHLYFTVTGFRLNLFRIGLFRTPDSNSKSFVSTPKLSVMLPLSASGRQVFYLPPKADEGRKCSAGPGMVLVGSYGAQYQRVQLQHRSARTELQGMGTVTDKELPEYGCPAVGFYVDEEKDLGGWTELDTEGTEEGEVGVTATADGGERFRDGKLTRKIEAFNWQDDIDMEGICDWCNGPMYYR